MPRKQIEMTPTRIIGDNALRDLNFQDGLVRAGIAVRNPKHELEYFEELLQSLRMSPTDSRLIKVLPPLGYLTSVSLISSQIELPHDQVRVFLNRFKRTLIDQAPESPITKRMQRSAGNPYQGLGVGSIITPKELAVAYLIAQAPEPLLSTVIAEKVFDSNGTKEEWLKMKRVRSTVAGLRQLATKATLLSIQNKDRSIAYRWESAF